MKNNYDMVMGLQDTIIASYMSMLRSLKSRKNMPNLSIMRGTLSYMIEKIKNDELPEYVKNIMASRTKDLVATIDYIERKNYPAVVENLGRK